MASKSVKGLNRDDERDRQTDHATVKCLAIGRIALQEQIPPNYTKD